MKTAMQELIERLDKTEKQLEKENNLVMSSALYAAKNMALEALEKEKEQIKRAFEFGIADAYNFIEDDAEQYYKETYNQTYNENE
jgi:predicted patatin/cPLA2 family phospholipase